MDKKIEISKFDKRIEKLVLGLVDAFIRKSGNMRNQI